MPARPPLLAEGARYAEYCLHNIGQIPPTMFAQTCLGMLIFMPDGMKDVEAKQDFVTKIRLIAANTSAKLVRARAISMAKD